MATNRTHAYDLLQKLTKEADYSHEEILDYLINNHLSGHQALDAIKGFMEDNDLDENLMPTD